MLFSRESMSWVWSRAVMKAFCGEQDCGAWRHSSHSSMGNNLLYPLIDPHKELRWEVSSVIDACKKTR